MTSLDEEESRVKSLQIKLEKYQLKQLSQTWSVNEAFL